jgi:L,D-transpeptidase catalytic domain
LAKIPAFDRGGLVSLRVALVSTLTLAFLAGLTSSADAFYPRRLRYAAPYGGWYGDLSARRMRAVSPSRASYSRRERAEPKKDPGFGDMPKGPLQIAVNISTQRVTLYSNGVRVAQGPVSTGVPGHPTPLGVFSIIEKDRHHHSNIYSGAPMPFMQRITWSGVALHEGALPGHPASHGCIRTSHDFAQKLWPVTRLGVRFIVSRHEVAPVEFEHPKLFVPKQKPPEATVAMKGVPDGRGAPGPIRFAETAPQSQNDATESLPSAQTGDEGVRATGTVAPLAPAQVPAPSVPAELRKSVEVPAAAPPTASSEGEDLAKPAPAIDPSKPAAPRVKSAEQPVKRTGQVAVFVSRKEKKIFVRQGMVPMFDMPILIEEPDAALGTHVFTAMAVTDDGAGMRWNVMTIPTDGSMLEREGRRRFREPPRFIYSSKPPSTAAEALNRIQMPKEAADRISELLIPGSSLVVSDEGLGRETGRGTEFIVLTRQ